MRALAPPAIPALAPPLLASHQIHHPRAYPDIRACNPDLSECRFFRARQAWTASRAQSATPAPPAPPVPRDRKARRALQACPARTTAPAERKGGPALSRPARRPHPIRGRVLAGAAGVELAAGSAGRCGGQAGGDSMCGGYAVWGDRICAVYLSGPGGRVQLRGQLGRLGLGGSTRPSQGRAKGVWAGFRGRGSRSSRRPKLLRRDSDLTWLSTLAAGPLPAVASAGSSCPLSPTRAGVVCVATTAYCSVASRARSRSGCCLCR